MLEKDENPISIGDLYPHISAQEQAEAAETLRRYLELVKRIYEHIAQHDPKTLTELRRRARLRKKGQKALR